MKEFSELWTDANSWEKRAKTIKQNILKGMEWDKISSYNGPIKVIKHSQKMDKHMVENDRSGKFSRFYVTGNLYRPIKKQNQLPAILSPRALRKQTLYRLCPTRSAYLASIGAIVFAYDMVGYGESKQVRHKMPISLLLQTWNSKRVLDYLIGLPE